MKIPRQVKRTLFAMAILSISSLGLYFLLIRLGYLPPFSAIVCLNNCTSSSHLHTPQAGKALLNYNQPIAELIATANIDKTKTSILIEKSKYRLTLYYNQDPLKSYPVVFGKNPGEDKLKEGDFRTPEGIFTIRDLYNHPNWSKFIWLDYPNKTSWQKHFQAKIGGKIKWSDSIGGEVGIHGVPASEDNLIDKRSNWTWGCISLKNKDVDELYQLVQQGTKVEIIP